MKNVFAFSLIAMLALSTVSLAAAKTTVKSSTTTKTTAPAAAPARVANPTVATYGTTGVIPRSSWAISPKLGMGTGDFNSFLLGCEAAYPMMKAVDLMGEVEYYMVSGGAVLAIAGNGVYHFDPVPGAPGNFYAGGGLIYMSWSNISRTGLQLFGGIDIPLAGSGTCFGQVKYLMISNVSGVALEGGYRFYL